MRQESQLLYYHAPNRVLICRECRYAIQPSATSRHLMELHQKYRSERQDLMEYIEGLELADPRCVVLPEPHEEPIPFLPIEAGYACDKSGCHHLCVTLKRMKNHWAKAHLGAPSETVPWHPVRLQTLFRGNQLRYFIVSDGVKDVQRYQPDPGVNMGDSRSDVNAKSIPISIHDGDVNDMALMEHFQRYTYSDLGYKSASRQAWQTAIPKLAFDHPFLMHGVFACSALHCAYLRPEQRAHYRVTAAYHQNKALPEFREAIMHVDAHNCHALLAFSQLLMVYCLASEEQDENLLLVGGRDEPNQPDWLYVIRGSCTLFGSSWESIQEGPLLPLISEGSITVDDFARSEVEKPDYDARLDSLTHSPLFGVQENAEAANDKVSPLPSTFLKLCKAFTMAKVAQSQSRFTFWTAMYIWPAQVSHEYLDLLKARDPEALVLLAHYCILLEPLEVHWFCRGIRRRLLTRVHSQLDPQYRHWLQWPMAEVGLQE